MKGRLESEKDLIALREAILGERDPNQLCVTICGGTGCRAWGGEEVRQAFIEEIRKQGLAGQAGCDAHGTAMVSASAARWWSILPQEIFYQQVTVEDVPEVVSETLLGGRVIQRLLYTNPATGRAVVYDHDVPFYQLQMRKVFSDNGRIDPDGNPGLHRPGGLFGPEQSRSSP